MAILSTDIWLALASDVGDISELQTQSKQLVGAINEVLTVPDTVSGKQFSYIIAPSNVVNKEKADLVLSGIIDENGHGDAHAINLAFQELVALRGDGTQSIRIDFLGGDIIVEETIGLPDNCRVYGNGVNLIARTASEDYRYAQDVDGNDYITGTPPFTGIMLSGSNNIDVDGFSFYLTTDSLWLMTSTTAIFLDSGNVSNCKISNIEWGAIGICVGYGTVSSCIIGTVEEGSYGIDIQSGTVSKCTVSNITNGTGIMASGKVENCDIRIGVSNGVGVEGMSNDTIISNNIIDLALTPQAIGIYTVTGIVGCLITNNIITNKYASATAIFGNAQSKNNLINGVWTNYGA